jgi:hypothetical protein
VPFGEDCKGNRPPFLEPEGVVWWTFTNFPTASIGRRVTQRSNRTIAQAVSRWLPTAAARVRSHVKSCRICGGQSRAGAGFLRVLRFPLPILIPPIAPQSPSPIIWGWYNRPVSGRSTKWTQLFTPHPKILKRNEKPESSLC